MYHLFLMDINQLNHRERDLSKFHLHQSNINHLKEKASLLSKSCKILTFIMGFMNKIISPLLCNNEQKTHTCKYMRLLAVNRLFNEISFNCLRSKALFNDRKQYP
jgi:hypothetical protein